MVRGQHPGVGVRRAEEEQHRAAGREDLGEAEPEGDSAGPREVRGGGRGPQPCGDASAETGQGDVGQIHGVLERGLRRLHGRR